MIFIFLRVQIISPPCRFTPPTSLTFPLAVPSQGTTDVNVKIARRTKYPPLSLSLFISLHGKTKIEASTRSNAVVIRYAGKSALCAVFYARTHNTPVSVHRKQVLSIRRGKINKWRSWCSPGPGCLPLSSGAYRVFTSVKTGSVNMHVLCINTERSPMLLLLLLLLFSPSFHRLFPAHPYLFLLACKWNMWIDGREERKVNFRGGKRCEYVRTYVRTRREKGFIMFNSRFRVSFRDTGSISA